MRLDLYLVEHGYFESRSKAQYEIKNQNVCINDKIITKSSYEVSENDIVTIKDDNVLKYVSKGGLKLEKALDYFHIDVNDKTCLDIGLSTGGFTDCLLQKGAKFVYGIDTGKDQVHPTIKGNEKTTCFEQTNFLDFDLSELPNIDIISIDVSFISVTKILERVIKSFKNTIVVFLIKPQFELGKTYIKNGIVKDSALHNKVKQDIKDFLKKHNVISNDIIESPIHGGDGNKEFLTYIRL